MLGFIRQIVVKILHLLFPLTHLASFFYTSHKKISENSTTETKGKKLALLVASPVLGLTGPENDVDSMSNVLERHGFEIVRLVRSDASRDRILAGWKHLINICTSSDDVVVIYYSGHGGLVESTEATGPSRRYQFIVPFDYSESTADEFRGILDIEITHLLRETTKKTHNVTMILDCCHSGRMARDPRHNDRAVPKHLFGVKRHDLSEHEDKLRRNGLLEGATFVEGNPHAVRIAAAATGETAWEFSDEQNQSVGAFTKAFTAVLGQAVTQGITWRSTMFRICEIVTSEFPGQHPRVEGPNYDRVLFSTTTKEVESFPATIEDDTIVIQAGRISGVKEQNSYTIMPTGAESVDEDQKLGDATVHMIQGLQTLADFDPAPNRKVPNGPATAFLKKEAVYRWPVAVPNGFTDLENRIKRSRLLRTCDDQDANGLIVEFQQEGEDIIGYNGNNMICISSKTVEDAVAKAEQLARAQHLLTIPGGVGEESLQHSVDLECKIGSPEPKFFNFDGTDTAQEGQRALVTLNNTGEKEVYVSVFDVNVWGKIYYVSRGWARGIHLPPGHQWTLGQRDFTPTRKGQKLSWPSEFPKRGPIPETLVFIVTEEEVDLREFSRPGPGHPRGRSSNLQDLAHRLSFSHGREFEQEREITVLPYDVLRVSYLLCPNQA